MSKFLRKLSIAPHGLRKKLLISFIAMSIIPLLSMVYMLYDLVTPHINTLSDIKLFRFTVIGFLAIGISWLGLLLAKSIIDPIIDMSIDARTILDGDYQKIIKVSGEDETGKLASTINLMAARLKTHLNELKDYGEKTREVDADIQKKMAMFSELLKVSDLIAGSADFAEIRDLILSQVTSFYEKGFAILYLSKAKSDEFEMDMLKNIENNELLKTTVKLGRDYLGSVLAKRKIVIIDRSIKRTSPEFSFKMRYKLNNVVILPIFAGKEIRGLFLAGHNNTGFTYTNQDVDMLKVYGKQLSLAVESNMVMKEAEQLSQGNNPKSG